MSAKGLRWTAIGIGVLFWISDLTTLIGGLITGPLPTTAAGLANAQAHAAQLVAGTLVTHANDFAVIGYGILLYTVLARLSPAAAAGVFAFKVVEGTLLLVGAAALLSAADTQALAFQFWAGRLAAFAYLVSTPILNATLYLTRLVPRWLSAFGLVACALLATGLALGVGDPTRGFEPGQLLVIPIILWELTFATYLIVRGFNPTGPIMAPWSAAPASGTPGTSSASWSPSTS
jgi:hypothetical protein